MKRTARPVSRRNADPVAFCRERGAKRLATGSEVVKHLCLVRWPAKYGFIASVVAHEAKVVGPAFAVFERHFGDHADPVGVLASAMAGLEAEVAKTVVDR